MQSIESLFVLVVSIIACIIPVYSTSGLYVSIFESVDLIYLWVNGSDPEWNQRFQQFKPKEMQVEDISDRYIEKNELLLSLRTVDQYLPWIRKIHIITDNQFPNWINVHNSKINFVSHQALFGKGSNIFNSNSIQYAISRIPGLANNFIITDDDVFWIKYIPKSFYFNSGTPIIQIDDLKNQLPKNFVLLIGVRMIVMKQFIFMLCSKH